MVVAFDDAIAVIVGSEANTTYGIKNELPSMARVATWRAVQEIAVLISDKTIGTGFEICSIA